jgi:hypothetical protein
MAWTNPRTWTAAIPSVADFNTHIRDNMNALPRELSYNALSGDFTIIATHLDQTGIITSSPVTYDGSTTVMVEFVSYSVITGTADEVVLTLWQDTTQINGNYGLVSTGAVAGRIVAAPVRLSHRVTPASGSHTFAVKAYRGTENGVVKAPGFIRVVKV